MNDNRIWKPEQLNKRDKEVMNNAIDSFYEKHYGKGIEERQEERMMNNPNYIQINGKLYDKRYYKGERS